MNDPFLIFSTALAGIGGKADDKMRGAAFANAAEEVGWVHRRDDIVGITEVSNTGVVLVLVREPVVSSPDIRGRDDIDPGGGMCDRLPLSSPVWELAVKTESVYVIRGSTAELDMNVPTINLGIPNLHVLPDNKYYYFIVLRLLLFIYLLFSFVATADVPYQCTTVCPLPGQ